MEYYYVSIADIFTCKIELYHWVFKYCNRGTRESTPCSLIRGSDSIGNPGSSTKPRSLAASDRLTHNSIQQDIPSTHEIEEFFAFAEQQQQKRFIEKYVTTSMS